PEIKETKAPSSMPPHRTFKVKYIAGNTVYIDGGVNSGLRSGMKLDIRGHQSPSGTSESLDRRNDEKVLVASLRIIGVAATSAITEVLASERVVQVGDSAELTPQDAAA